MNPKSKWINTKLASLCLSLSVSLPSFAGVILSPISVDTNIVGSQGELNTIDQTGLSATFLSGVSDFSSYIAGEPTHFLNGPGDSWTAPIGSLPGNLDFDLGSIYSLAQTALWTATSGFGIDNFDLFIASVVDFSDATLIGNFSAIETPQQSVIGVQVFDTVAVGRYIRMGVNSSHGQGEMAVNMGEIAFNVESIPVPAPITLIFAGMTLLIFRYTKAKDS